MGVLVESFGEGKGRDLCPLCPLLSCVPICSKQVLFSSSSSLIKIWWCDDCLQVLVGGMIKFLLVLFCMVPLSLFSDSKIEGD